MRHVGDYDHGRMQGLRDAGQNVSQIARLMKYDRKTVRTHLEAAVPPSARKKKRVANKKKGKSVKSRREALAAVAAMKIRYDRCTSTATTNNMKDKKIRVIHVIKYASPAAMVRGMFEEFGIKTTAATVRRDLEAMHYRLVKRTTTPALNAAKKMARLIFCRKMLRLSDEELHKICFSDEKWFDSNCHGSIYEYVAPGKKASRRYKVQAPCKVFVWGVICADGERFYVVMPTFAEMLADEKAAAAVAEKDAVEAEAARFQALSPVAKRAEKKAAADACAADVASKQRIAEARHKRGMKPARVPKEKVKKEPKGMDDARYAKYVLEAVRTFIMKKGRVLQQDGAQCHRSAATAATLKRLGIRVMPSDRPWPSNSPDLSPVETCWAIVARRVSDHGPHSVADLRKFVQEELDKISKSTVAALVRSFRARCKECVRVRGDLVVMKSSKK